VESSCCAPADRPSEEGEAEYDEPAPERDPGIHLEDDRGVP
jgi:hypothetical protein